MYNILRSSVSICMATYNGEQFIEAQLNSILKQLMDSDEIIIFDDASSDRTVGIILSYNSDRIKLFHNKTNLGYIKTFEKAIAKSKNSVIFLSDQDDIWIEGRLNKMYAALCQSNKNLLLCSNFQTFTDSGNNISRFKTRLCHFSPERYKSNVLGIFKGKMAYFGCTMAFKSEYKKHILPFPDYIDAHDLWIAMLGNVMGNIIHLEDNTLLHRIHSNNTSFVKRNFRKKIFTRFLFFKSLIEAVKRKYFINKNYYNEKRS